MRIFQFMIYIVSHLFIICGTLISKSAVLILATNLFDRSVTATESFHSKCSTNPAPKRQFQENEMAIFIALLFIQLLPDVFAIFQSMYRFLALPIRDYRIYKLVGFFAFFHTFFLLILLFRLSFLKSFDVLDWLYFCSSSFLNWMLLAVLFCCAQTSTFRTFQSSFLASPTKTDLR